MILFNKPTLLGTEVDYINQAITQKNHISGDGYFTKKSSKYLESYLNAPKVLLTPSCTAALEMAALILDLKEGDEVICPSYTFATTVSSFSLRGAKPVFIDIRGDTLNIDESKIEEAINSNTKAISVVHYAGVACEMDKILDIAKKYNLYIIEDAAQAIGSSYKGKKCGTFGDFGCFSFHETKNIVCGEGGALVINNEKFIDKAEIIREKGTNRSKFLRGQVDKYTWLENGSSYLLSDINSAYLYPQVQRIGHINKVRLALWKQYHEVFSKYEKLGRVKIPVITKSCVHNGHMYYLIFENIEERNEYINYMKSREIMVIFHYIPLHNSPAGLKYGVVSGGIDNTNKTSDCLVRLPLFYNLEQEEIVKVITETIKFLES